MDLESIFNRYGLTRSQLEQFQHRFTIRHLVPGEVVFHQGDPSDTFYFISAGELEVTRRDGEGVESVLSIRGPGELFGEVGLLNEIPRTATVTALTHSQLYVLDRQPFFQLLDSDAAFATLLDRIHVERLLSDVGPFGNLDDESLGAIRQILGERRLGASETLVHQGDPMDALYLVTQGQVRFLATGKDGGQTLIGRVEPGGYLGADGLTSRRRHAASAVAEGPTRVLVLERARFRRLARRRPGIAFNLPGRGGLLTLLPFLLNKSAFMAIPQLAMSRPRLMVRGMALVTLLLVLGAVLPSVWPNAFPFLHPLRVDTDPESMLSADEPVRVFHREMKARMDLLDMLVVGVVNESHPDGVFNVNTLARIHELARFAETLQWPDPDHPGKQAGVVAVDIMAPPSVDVIEQVGPGTIRFSWLMPTPPADAEEALAVKRKMQRFPMMNGTFLSEDGRAINLYLPLTSKDVSFRVYDALLEHIAGWQGDERYLITGLPVAEDAFGVEMFYQMAISAPLAMLVIFALMYVFFRNLLLITAPMILAMVAVLCTMALLVMTGNTLHIMSSMIPIFIMPIAVLDSVHMLSEFTAFYPRIRDRQLTLKHVVGELFVPMLYTSLTTAIGFGSLALVPIPPVQVFGLFVAVGVLLAWLLTMSFIPAFIVLLPEARLRGLAGANGSREGEEGHAQARLLRATFRFTQRRAGGILLVALVTSLVCLYGVTQLQVNDNPVRWFAEDHPIREADGLLNDHFAGTYMAYLALQAPDRDPAADQQALEGELAALAGEFPSRREQVDTLLQQVRAIAAQTPETARRMDRAAQWVEQQADAAEDDDSLDLWSAAQERLDQARQQRQLFKRPAVLEYMSRLQQALLETGIVGKSVSVADIAKTVNRELRGGDPAQFRIPGSQRAVAQTLMTYESSHRPQDLWRFVTPDARTASVWVLLNSGDNRDMARVVQALDTFMAANPPPEAIRADWFGLTYINVVWQEKMVSGMLYSIAGGFLTVLLMMTYLLRSALWGLLAMIPLSCTILLIFGVLGLAGRPYDMPVAVLSALTIGLAVDFTIHFLVRHRHLVSQSGSWDQALALVFGEPAEAIIRNILVVAIGFLPLLAAPLVPYNTVGILIATILFASGIATLLILPALLKAWHGRFFPGRDRRRTTLFGCRDALFAGGVSAVLLWVAAQSLLPPQQDPLPWILALALGPAAIAAGSCLRRTTRAAAREPV